MADIDPVREFLARQFADWAGTQYALMMSGNDYQHGEVSGAFEVLDALAHATGNEDLIPMN